MPHSRSLEVGISDKLSQARWDVAAPFCDRDEIWVTCCTPKSQWHFGLTLLPFMQWEHAILPKIKKFRLIISTKKTLWTMFWDRQCDLLEFMSRGVYCETFKRWGVHTEQRVWDAECQHFFFLCVLHDNDSAALYLVFKVKIKSPYATGYKWTIPFTTLT